MIFILIFFNNPQLISSKEGLTAFLILAITFNGYFSLLVFSVDSVTFDIVRRRAYVEQKIGPFKKSRELDVSEFKFISIFIYGWGDGNFYEIGLKKDIASEPVRLISTYFFFDTWKKAIRIANYLKLSIYDTIWPNLVIWKPENLPPDTRQRKNVLKKNNL